MLPECIYRDNLILTQFNKKSHQLNFKDRKIKKNQLKGSYRALRLTTLVMHI